LPINRSLETANMAAINLQTIEPISSEEYEHMGRLGILPSSGVELIRGKIREMSPKGDRHFFVVSELNDILSTHPERNYRVCCESLSLQALSGSTPDPDVALARLGRSYAKRRPQPSEIALIIEVADTSYAYDVGEKRDIYAQAGIPEYWIFDIRPNRSVVHCFSQPLNGQYLTQHDKTIGDLIAPQEFPAVRIDLASVFDTSEGA
jgi:Uma2 family endonuclease